MSRRRRFALLIGTGLILITSALAYIEFHFDLRSGEGPAGPAVAIEPFQSVWSDREILLLGIGDSVTAGFGARPGYSYFDRLADNPSDEFPDMKDRCLRRVLPKLKTKNVSVSGSNSLQHIERIRDFLDPQPENVFGLVVMTTGGNDLIHWYGRTKPREGAMYGATLSEANPWIQRFEERLEKMVQLIKDRFPGGCLIVVADIYDPSDARGDPESAWLPAWPDVLQIHAGYNAAIRNVAARHSEVRVAPMYQEFLGHGIHCRKFWHPGTHTIARATRIIGMHGISKTRTSAVTTQFDACS